MPILEDDDMPDRAVYWGATEGRTPDGEPVFEEPVEIWVNYRHKSGSMVGPGGTAVSIDAQLSSQEDLALGSKIWVAPDHTESALDQWYESGSAGQVDEVMRIEAYNRTRDAYNRETRFSYGLKWYRDTGGTA
jgi:hypothetical protein